MKASTKKHPQKTQPELAKQYRVDVRTIRRWQELDAPLHSADEMVGWIEDRRAGTRYDEGGGAGPENGGINPLRCLVEAAGADALRHAMEHLAEPLTCILEEEKGFSPKDARGIVIVLWMMLTKARQQWSDEALYDATFTIYLGMSVDGMTKKLALSHLTPSEPSGYGNMIPAGPKLRKVFAANGAEKLLDGPWRMAHAST